MRISDLSIRHLGPKGDGIHLGTGGGRVFVERAIPGDRVKARVFNDGDGIPRGEILKILEPSPHRQKPPCIHYERCGSCTLQHLSTGYYRDWKTALVREAFQKQDLRPRRWLDTIFVGRSNRRRATFTAEKRREKVILGYYRRRSQEVADIDSCLIADPRLLELREEIKPFLGRILKDGISADVFLQIVGDGADMVVTGPVGRHGEPDTMVREAMEQLVKASPISRISWRARERDSIEPMVTRRPVTATFGSLKVNLPPAAFLQPTPEGEQALVKAVLAALPAEGKFVDLFSGCGTFSGPMLARGAVDAYESIPQMVNALSKAARGKKLKVFRRDLFRSPLRREEINRYHAVVFDPPRAGCLEQVTAMASSRVRTLIGVSCNPATFARDARALCNGGYRLQTLQAIDQFLWSHHVEVVGVFSK